MSFGAVFDAMPDEADPLDAALDVSEDLARQIEHANDQRKLLANTVRQSTRTVLHYPAQVRRIWAGLCAAGWSGRAEEIQQHRARFLKLFENLVSLIARVRNLAARAAELAGGAIAGVDQLAQAADELERLRAEIFERWNTLEDLESLLAETFPLPRERLEALAAHHPPPQSWYDEDRNLF
jgi:hypothetical protein